MATADLTAKIFHDEDAARAHFEALRWPHGPVCPHCGTVDNATEMKGRTTRPGLYKCKSKECRKPFSATMGTLYERSHIPLHKWLLATHLMCASKRGVSAHQLFRMLGFGSYKTAWFMAHRIREAMNPADPTGLGGPGKVVEADETYVGGKAANKHAVKRRPADIENEMKAKVTSFLAAHHKMTGQPEVTLNLLSEQMLSKARNQKFPTLGPVLSDHVAAEFEAAISRLLKMQREWLGLPDPKTQS